ncbi:phage portal protein [Bifidobacterium imperatoris]|uniref:Phage portal protein n=1 Tax=Bifidobacterium imperatoris TaxID=2020965 RepID=A0A2N5IQW0_9BIFI|nr:phage portal protein [Bifidobacterium imperatoris]PLS24346.1 phage portal protein [Bifidobacterium imperatoris]QSY56952.1 phage portal protein [Bifidobacterium imperatoris]
MNLFERIIDTLAPAYRAATSDDGPLATPPSRVAADRDVMHFSTVFRAVQILETSIAGLPIRQLRNGVEVTPQADVIARPDPNRYRTEFVKLTVGDLIVRGEAFWLKLRGLDGSVKGLRVLPASLVTIDNISNDPANPIKRYGYLGRTYQDADILHLPFVSLPGRMHGIGPIEAGRAEINGAMDARDAKALWFEEPAQPSGILSSDKIINNEISENTKRQFEKNMKGVKVIGAGMKYTPLLLSPADMQYLETQKFDTTLLSRLFGIPPKLMLAESGSSLTYSNVEQEWSQFADFTLDAYVQPMRDALSTVIPRGHVVEFGWDAFRRSDTKTRMETYKTAIEAGVMTVNEARAHEGMPPLAEAGTSQEGTQNDEA